MMSVALNQPTIDNVVTFMATALLLTILKLGCSLLELQGFGPPVPLLTSRSSSSGA